MFLSHHPRKTASVAAGSVVVLTLGFAAVTGSAQAADPATGTLTDTSGAVSWSGGPLAGTLVGSALLGTAQCAPETCDEFGLTVDVPDGYGAAHSIALTLTNTGTDDYDVYVLDSATGDVVATGAKAGDENVTLPATDASYDVRVLAYTPATATYAAKATIVDGGTGTAPTPTPPGSGSDVFTTYPAPADLPDSNNAGEPSIGNSFKTGATTYQASLSTYKVAFDDAASPATASWSDVSANAGNGCPQGSTASLDPILFTDHETGRTFESQLTGADSFTCYTDDDGATWSPSTGGGIPSGIDHQTIGGGPFSEGDLVGAATAYPHDVYYCSQDVATAFCAASHNGGQTFEAGVPAYTLNDCGGLHGHIKVAPDGTAYVPNRDCNGEQAVVTTTDGGVTWTVNHIPGSKAGDSDPSVGIGRNGTLYAGMVGVNTDSSGKTTSSIPAASVSTDQGKTWSPVQDLGTSAGIKNAVFPTTVAGDDDRAAVAYLGTTTAGDYQDKTFPGVWDLYIDMTFDGGQTWTTYDATPNDPVQRGSICTGGTTCGADRNLLDFIDSTIDDHGRVLVGFADGCIKACATDPSVLTHDAYATIARQSSGLTLFSKYDPAPVTPPTTPPTTTHNLAVQMKQLTSDGGRVTTVVKVTNTGNVDEGRALLFITDNGDRVRRIALQLAAGATTRQVFHFRTDPGRHVVAALADPRNRITESDETDNSAQRTIRVR